MKKSNCILAIICSVLSIYVIATAMKYPKGVAGVPGPGVFPIMISVLLLATSVSIMVSSSKMEDSEIGWLSDDSKRVYISMIVLIVYVVALSKIGFVVTSVIFMTSMLQWFRNGKPVINALISLIFVALVYLVFSIVLNVPMDFGILI